MKYTEHYDNFEQRNSLCFIAKGNGFTMLHDNFDEDWKMGDESHGTLTFTNEPAPQSIIEPVRDLVAEIDELKAENTEIKAKLKQAGIT